MQSFKYITARFLQRNHFRHAENYGVIHLEVYPVVPPKVEYSLTEMGKSFLPILYSINKWAEKYTAE